MLGTGDAVMSAEQRGGVFRFQRFKGGVRTDIDAHFAKGQDRGQAVNIVFWGIDGNVVAVCPQRKPRSGKHVFIQRSDLAFRRPFQDFRFGQTAERHQIFHHCFFKRDAASQFFCVYGIENAKRVSLSSGANA